MTGLSQHEQASICWVCMEQKAHGILKKAVASELMKEGYELFFEPRYSPFSRLEWSAYRPDIMGLASGRDELRLVFVECETSPRLSRMREKTAKIQLSLSLQGRLDERHSFRFLLVIPFGTLSRVLGADLRRLWEIWIANDRAQVVTKIKTTSTRQLASISMHG